MADPRQLRQTPSQTVGPYFAYGLTGGRYGLSQVVGTALFPRDAPGEHIRIFGRVLDGAGEGVPDAMIEAWQADAAGRHGEGPAGFGRVETDPDGRFAFTTVRPGSIGAPHAPHIGLIVFMRGLLTHTFSRLYFPEDALLHAADPVLSVVPQARRATLVAVHEPDGYRFDIRMQGEGETVFLEF
jgi:protocatechuate 3,4-dioxygenase alpha subunit